MVQVDISQLSTECNGWREQLRQLRDEFTNDETRLTQTASKTLSKDQLQDVEHLHNQFHIQLINIHDLKQAIKNHDRKMSYEIAANHGQLHDETVAEHEHLFGRYQHLEQTLADLPLSSDQGRWRQLRAVREGRLFICDGHHFFNRPGPRLVESAEILAEILSERTTRSSGNGWLRLDEWPAGGRL